MSIIRGLFRPRVWFQLIALGLLAWGVGLALSTASADQGTGLADAGLLQARSAASGASAYTRSVIATFDYGSGAAQLGRRVGSDGRPIGPASFAIDGGGRLAIADDVNGRVQVYSPDGKLVRSVPAKDRLHDLAFDTAGDLYTLTAAGSVAVHDVETGQQKWRAAAVSSLAKSLATFGVVGDSVDLRFPEQYSYALAKAGKALPAADQSAKRKGAKSASGAYYSTSYRDRGHVYRFDAQGKVVRDIPLNLADVASVSFLAEDSSGNVFVQVERFTAKDRVGVEVRQFDSRGTLTATITLAPVTYIEMTRSTLVTEDGTVYQLLPTESGISLLRWQKS